MNNVHWMRKGILYSSIGIALFVAMLLSPTSFAFAATSSHPLTPPKVTPTPAKVKPLDGGGGCSGLKTGGTSDLGVSVKACIGTDTSDVNGDGYVSLDAANASHWSSCDVGIYLYKTNNTSTPVDSIWDTCFSYPHDFDNQQFGEASTSKSNGTYFSVVEVVGTFEGHNIYVTNQSPNQCVGVFC